MFEISDSMAGFLTIGFFVLTAYWSIRGILQLFQRHNSILVIFYIVALFPIAYLHALLLGIFGKSRATREAAEIEAEASRQIAI